MNRVFTPRAGKTLDLARRVFGFRRQLFQTVAVFKPKATQPTAMQRRLQSKTLLITAFFGLLCGCGEDAPTLDWSLKFQDMSLQPRLRFVQSQILDGGCDGTVVFTFLSYETPRRLPRLSSGNYGFYAQVGDSTCLWFASGCAEAMLPSEQDVEVTLLSVAKPRAACEEVDCEQAGCQESATP